MMSGIACKAEQCLDQGIKSDNTTLHDTMYYMHRPQLAITYSTSRNLPQLLPLVNSTFAVKDTTFSGTAMLDSGYSTCIVPISQLPKEARKHMTHSKIHMKGINGSITILGELNCNITIGNHKSPVFKEINMLVTAQATPILISQNILGHDRLDSYSINGCNATVELSCMLTSGQTVHMTPILPASSLTMPPPLSLLRRIATC